MFPPLRRHTYTIILHAQRQHSVSYPHADQHMTVLRRIFDGIGNEVVRHHLNHPSVHWHGVSAVRSMEIQRDMFPLRPKVEIEINLSKEADDLRLLQMQLQRALLRHTEREKLAHQSQHTLRRDLHGRNRLAHVVGYITERRDAVNRRADDSQWSTELMGYIGEEKHLVIRELFLHFQPVA